LRWISVALYQGSTAVWNNGLIQYYHGICGEDLKKTHRKPLRKAHDITEIRS
jgi:hypothetical protein